MKTNLILFFISLTVFGCDKSSNKEYLFTKDFLQDNAGWEIEKDTISKTLVFCLAVLPFVVFPLLCCLLELSHARNIVSFQMLHFTMGNNQIVSQC